MPSERPRCADRINTSVDVHGLPRIGPNKMSASFESNQAYDGCGRPIVRTDIEYEFNLGANRPTSFTSAVPGPGRPSCSAADSWNCTDLLEPFRSLTASRR